MSERSNRRILALRRRDERGAAVIEFAILLPVLILLVFGIIEFSIAYNHKQGLQAAAREGARIAALPQTTQSQIINQVRGSLAGVLSSSELAAATITVTPSQNQPCDLQPAGTHVVVTVRSNDAVDIPLMPSTTVTLTGKGDFLCE